MRKCSENKVLNSDNKFRTELEQILNFCRTNGYKPVNGADMARRLTSIEHALYIRNKKNMVATHDITDIINEIKSYPTKKQKQQADEIQRITQDQDFFDVQYQKIIKIFPHVKLVRVIYGDDLYNKFITSKIDMFATKIVSDIMDLVTQKMMREYPYYSRDFDVLFKFIGVGVTDADIQKIQNVYSVKNITTRRVPTKDGLNHFELGVLYGVTSEYIRSIKARIARFLHARFNKDILNAYVSGDINAFMSVLPDNFRCMYMFQRKYNIADMLLSDLLSAGQMLYDMSLYSYLSNKVKKVY